MIMDNAIPRRDECAKTSPKKERRCHTIKTPNPPKEIERPIPPKSAGIIIVLITISHPLHYYLSYVCMNVFLNNFLD